MCLVSITRRDDTPMDASSISEEGHHRNLHHKESHPSIGCASLFCYGISSFCFQSMDELQCTTRGIMKVMEFWGEAITVRAMAPLEAHVTVYLAMSHTNPSNGEKEPHTPPQQTPPTGGTLHHLQAELGDLANHELHQLIEDLM